MALRNLSAEQRLSGLARSAEARKCRADAKGMLSRGEITFESLLGSENVHVQKMRVKALLMAVPGVGKVKADQILDDCKIAVSRRISGLGANQKRALLERFE